MHRHYSNFITSIGNKQNHSKHSTGNGNNDNRLVYINFSMYPYSVLCRTHEKKKLFDEVKKRAKQCREREKK
jgi:hypothetical protein